MADIAGQSVTTPRQPAVSGILWVVRVFTVIALGISCYLAWLSASGSLPVGCGTGSDCDEVLAGSWSKWFDLPVSFLAAAVYLAVLLASFGATPKGPPARQRRSWGILTALAILVAGAGIWFIVLQVGVVRHICRYCMAVHGSGLILAIAILLGVRKLPAGRRESSYRIVAGIRPQPISALMLAGVAGLGVLIAGQALSSKPQPQLTFGNSNGTERPTSRYALSRPASREVPTIIDTTLPTTTIATTTTTPTTSIAKVTTTNPAVPVERSIRFPLVDGDDSVPLDPEELPIIGSSNAANVVAVMSDYTCPHCRDMHSWWRDAVNRYGDQLVIVMLPISMEAKYNPRIKVTSAKSKNGFELAKLSLAVWRADKKSFEKMEDWLYEGQPRTPEAARAHAVELVGEDAMKKAETDPWVERTVKRNINIYVLDKGGSIPKILLTKQVKGGTLAGENGLFSMLENELGIHPTKPVRKPATRTTTAP